MTHQESSHIPPEGRILRQRGESGFLVQTGDNTARIVDVATGAVSTVPDLKSDLAPGGWEAPSDHGGASKAALASQAPQACRCSNLLAWSGLAP